MRRNLQKLITSLLLSVLCFMIAAPAVQAEELPAIKLKVKITQEGTLPNKEQEYTIKFKADDSANPMPEGSEEGVYTMKIKGADTKEFPEIRFSKVGIYRYTIWQEAGSHGRCTYDKAVYYITVYVTNSESGRGLDTTTVLYKDSESDKLDEAAFHNKYTVIKKEEPKETVPLTPQEPAYSSPTKTGDCSAIEMYLMTLAGSMLGISLLLRKRAR